MEHKLNTSFLFVLILLLSVVSCSSSVSLDSAEENTTAAEVSSELFPADLIVASPTSSTAMSTSLSETASTGYAMTVDLTAPTIETDVASLLAATDIADCAIEIELPNQSSATIPDCYGPTLSYENHPDIGDENSGELPSGDLGLWTETDTASGEACAAAEFNYRMDLVEARVQMAQLSLASMICVFNNSATVSPTIVDSVSTEDLSTELAAVIDSTSLSVTSATLSLDKGGAFDEYSYALILDVTDDTGTVQTLDINMSHQLLDADGETFAGLLTYQYNDSMAAGNCVGDITEAGSVKYNKNTDGDYAIRTDTGEFCMADDAPFNADGVLDPTYKYDGTTPGGWGNDYNILIANFSPETFVGTYAYAWQAGFHDGFSRVFNMTVSQTPTESTADAYFGYGLDVDDENFDGSIDGFICDWATGVSSHTLLDLVQHQSLVLDGTIYVADESHLLYAPTASCDYVVADDTDGFLFSYDLDADGTIDADEALSLSTDGITNELLDFSEMDFELPIAP